MNNEILAGFAGRYAAWLGENRAALEKADWAGAFKTFPYLRPDTGPFAPWPGKPLAQTRLGLVSSAGLYVKGEQEPFTADSYEGDNGFRVLPDSVRPSDVGIAHAHYPHEAALRDWSSVLPLDGLRAKVAAGELKGVGPLFSISGYSPRLHELDEHAIRPIVRALEEARVDGAMLVPV